MNNPPRYSHFTSPTNPLHPQHPFCTSTPQQRIPPSGFQSASLNYTEIPDLQPILQKTAIPPGPLNPPTAPAKGLQWPDGTVIFTPHEWESYIKRLDAGSLRRKLGAVDQMGDEPTPPPPGHLLFLALHLPGPESKKPPGRVLPQAP